MTGFFNKKKVIGYTAGVYDLFHIGHLNIFKNAKKYCDYLVVGINTDELVQGYKNRKPMIPLEQRMEIVKAIKYVDKTEAQDSLDRLVPALRHNASVVFIGSDWKGSERWTENERVLNEHNIKVIYLPNTLGISTTELIKKAKVN